MKVSEVMTADVVSLPGDMEIEEAARVMARQRISGVPVLAADGSVIGVVSELDLISKNGKTVSDVMSRNVISVTPDTEVEQVAHLLANRRIRRVPVMEGNRLVGVVSRSDLLKQVAMRWVCHVCGDVVRSATLPEQCPSCHADSSAFSRLAEPPGM